jgi:hypothetical protein
VVQQLQALSKGVASALKDLEFHRKRRKAAGGAVSRQWYVTSQDWIAGTVVSTAAPADAFGGEVRELCVYQFCSGTAADAMRTALDA